MRRPSWFPRLCASLIGVAVAAQLWAFPDSSRETKLACVACHSSAAGGVELTDGGKAFKASKKAPAATAKAAQYVGSNRCKTCHIAQHQAWSGTAHATALDTLAMASPARVAEVAAKMKITVKGTAVGTDACIKCHVTGFQLGGGYPGADSAKAASLVGVGCESCHGPGSLHLSAPMADKKKFIHTKVSSKTCVQCHTPVMSPTFDFEEWSKRGVHPIKAG